MALPTGYYMTRCVALTHSLLPERVQRQVHAGGGGSGPDGGVISRLASY